MWIEVTLNFTANQIIEAHENLEDYAREVLTIDKMPSNSRIWVNLDQAKSILFLDNFAVIMLGDNFDVKLYDPEEIAYLKALLADEGENNEWEEPS